MSVTIPRKRKSSSTKISKTRAGVQKIASPVILTAPPLQGPMGEPPFVEVITQPAQHDFIEVWQKLCLASGEDNPFLSPMFILPALAHLSKEYPLTLVATWQMVGAEKQLTGLFPMVSSKRQSLRGWLFGASASFWRHPYVPFCEPLLPDDPDQARDSVAAFVDWLLARRPRLVSFTMPALRETSQSRVLIEAEFLRHGVVLHSTRDRAHTHGLDFKPSHAPDVAAKVSVVRSIPETKRLLEKALCMDAASLISSTPVVRVSGSVLGNLEKSAFLRAVVRGFATKGQMLVASIDEPDAKASAVVIEGKQAAYLWWIMGPQAGNTIVEASLSAAVEALTGKKTIAATAVPMTGIWAEAVKTITVMAQLSMAEKKI